MLAPRSSALSSGAIAGAVVGSVVGALLIAFCVFPFVIRAGRRRYARDEDAGVAEMGQGPGGPILTPQDLDDSSYKRTSGSGPESGTVHDVPQPQPTALPQGATVQHSSPTSPTSPATGTDLSSQRDDQQVSPLTATAPTPPPAEASSPSHDGSAATAGRQSTRDPSVSDSYGPPSRELTAITSVGLTHEPESFDRPSDSHQHGHSHLKDSLRSLFQSRQSSQQQRRDSRRSTQGGKTESARSPSILTDDVLAQSQPAPSGLEFDTETPGLAWDYYHDPTLDIDVYGYYSQSALPPTTVAVAPSTQVSTLATFGSVFPTGQAPPATGDISSFVPTRPIPEEPDAISPDSDVTVTPAIFSRQSTFLQGKKIPTSLQRTDSLPTTIVADLPSPPLLQYSAGPSGNPMEMMKPTNSTESAWMLEHEMRRIEHSPPPPVIEPVPTMPLTVDEVPGALFDDALMPQAQSMFQPVYQPPYHSPPLASSEGGVQIHEDLSGYYNPDGLIASDYSTPPPSTGPSVQSTPETWLTPYTASPSPPAENRASINGQLRPPSPGLSASLSPSPGPAPSPGLSPEQSRGRSPVPSAGTSPGRSPGRSPAGPPGGFVCPECGVTKNSYHQFNHHRRYHDRPYACTYTGCELRFGTITHLKRHVNDKHVKTRKFYCTQPDCAYSRQGGKSFPRKDNWKRHMMNKHRIDPKDATDEENLEGLDVGDVDMDGA